ncbi:hypothetical protein [Phenylobacterium sp.]|uniref:hypothetical protein n=1 Tax=Phenylobacterium sp. TaxID=1871053 RepID=UPI0035644A3E
MTIGSDYPSPVTVNGYSCKNCTDVDYAKKHIDPAHPKDGPYGIDAKSDPAHPKDTPAVIFSGQLAALASTLGPSAIPAAAPQRRLDVTA